MNNTLQLVFLFRMFGRMNPGLPPRRKARTAHAWIEAAIAGIQAIRSHHPWETPLDIQEPLVQWAGQTLADASSAIAPPPGQTEADWGGHGSFRSHAWDKGGVSGSTCIFLAEMILDHLPAPFGRMTPAKQLQEVRDAKAWAVCHGRFVVLLLEVSEMPGKEQRELKIPDALRYMELMEEGVSEEEEPAPALASEPEPETILVTIEDVRKTGRKFAWFQAVAAGRGMEIDDEAMSAEIPLSWFEGACEDGQALLRAAQARIAAQAPVVVE